MTPKRISLLGATGSIGESTLKVLRNNPDRLKLVGIAGGRRWRELAAIAREFDVRHIAIYDEAAMREALRNEHLFPKGATISCGMEGLVEIAVLPEADMTVMAIVGTTGLMPTMAAIEAGKQLALASKEVLVLAGKFVMAAAAKKGLRIMPMDSEHNAVFQCMDREPKKNVARIILTASGGQFRDYTLEQMEAIRPQDALKNPNWDMGPKVTVDSSTMANKGLEVIEARWLFDVPEDRIDVVVHPQSIVHSMVQFTDGAVLAELSPPSMTFPIQHCLLYPDRPGGVHRAVDFSKTFSLDFRAPDLKRFPALALARRALVQGGVGGAVFNASNEVAVSAFLDGRIAYLDIARVIERTLDRVPNAEPENIGDVISADEQARAVAAETVKLFSK